MNQRRGDMPCGTVEQVAERIGELGALGVDRVMLLLIGERLLPAVTSVESRP